MKTLLITTGGTIASRQSEEGLIPIDTGEALAEEVPEIKGLAEIDICNLFSKDSSNMNPDDWLLLIRKIYEEKERYDSFLITHGTDTMAYTSAALSYVLRDTGKPVVLTGSMVPISHPDTDAKSNLIDSFRFLEALCEKRQNSVSICFAGKLIHGPRAKKITAKSNDAFKSVYYSDTGIMENGRARIVKKPFIDKVTLTGQPETKKRDVRFARDIFPLKLFPGFSASYLEKVIELRPSAIVFECFGLGGLPYLGEDLLPGIKKAVSQGILTVITTQCTEGGVDLSAYDVGQKTLKAGAVSAGDMNHEAIMAKLMWLLPQLPSGQAADLLLHNFCDEVGR